MILSLATLIRQCSFCSSSSSSPFTIRHPARFRSDSTRLFANFPFDPPPWFLHEFLVYRHSDSTQGFWDIRQCESQQESWQSKSGREPSNRPIYLGRFRNQESPRRKLPRGLRRGRSLKLDEKIHKRLRGEFHQGTGRERQKEKRKPRRRRLATTCFPLTSSSSNPSGGLRTQ